MRDISRVHAMVPMIAAAALGLSGLLATVAGVGLSAHQAMSSYLLAFCYFGGISLATLVQLMSFHAAHAKWMVVLRRPLEVMPAAPLYFLLFVPIALGLRQIFPWVHPGPEVLNDPHLHALYLHKRPWLNPTFFLLRSAFYFLAWGVIARLFLRWSTRQDAAPEERLTLLQRKLAAGALPLIGFVFALAGTDWLMTLRPEFFSTIWGLYFFSGAFVASIAALILVIYFLEQGPLRGLISAVHYHNLGKLLLAFLCFWAYMAFEQYLLIYIADLPAEIPWFIRRTVGAWKPVGWFLVFGHFLVPFFVLLSKPLKRRPRLLALVAGWVLFVHWVDLYFMVMPEVHPLSMVPSWTDLTAMLGVGGIAVSYFIFRMRAVRAAPVGDPYLEASVRYSRS